MTDAFDVLRDPVRRRILEVLAGRESSAGEIGAVVRAEFGISQPAVSLHLRVLRDRRLATVRASGAQRLYSIDPTPLEDIDAWLDRFRPLRTHGPTGASPNIAGDKRDRHHDAVSSPSAGPAKKHKKRGKRKQRKS
jgi:DNA-binding transcriptional ArsR family regulator